MGVGDAFLRFDLPLGVGLEDGVGEAFLFFGEAVGDGVGVAFFFRCLRVGVGDGSKTFLIFVPNDSSAASAAEAPNKSAPSKKQRIIVLRAIDVVGRFCELRKLSELTQTPYSSPSSAENRACDQSRMR